VGDALPNPRLHGGRSFLASHLGAFAASMPDFFIIRLGAVLALRGEFPYEPRQVQALVEARFPDDVKLAANSAFFLPPATIPLHAPFAVLPDPAARVAWAMVVALSAAASLVVLCILGTRWPGSPIEQLLPPVILLQYVSLVVIELGQTSFLFVGCVALGQWCFERSASCTPVWRRTVAGLGAVPGRFRSSSRTWRLCCSRWPGHWAAGGEWRPS
jgi:hypothetical protein